MAERRSVIAKKDCRRKTRGGGRGSRVAQLHLSGGVLRKKRTGNGERGEQVM